MFIIRYVQQSAFWILLCCIGVWCIQQHPAVQHKIQNYVLKILMQELGVELSVQEGKINFLTGSCSFKNGSVTPLTYAQTNWTFQKADVSIAWWESLRLRKFALMITLYDISASSILQHDYICPLIQHVRNIINIQNPLIPFTLHTVTINNISATCTGATCSSLSRCSETFTAEFLGSLTITRAFDKDLIATTHGTARGTVHILNQSSIPKYHIKASLQDSTWTIICNNMHHEGAFQIIFDEKAYHAKGTIKTDDANGLLKLSNLLNISTLSIPQSCSQMPYSYAFNIQHSIDAGGSASFTITHPTYGALSNQLAWDQSFSQLSCSSSNPYPLKIFPNWTILPNKLLATYQYHANTQTQHSTIQLSCHDNNQALQHTFSCNFQHNDKKIIGTGYLNDFMLNTSILLEPTPQLEEISFSLNNKKIASFSQLPTTPVITGALHIAFLERLFPDLLHDLAKNSSLAFTTVINFAHPDSLAGTFDIARGKLYIPGCMNIITKGHCDWTYLFPTRTLLLNNASTQFARGHCSCPAGIIKYNEDGSLNSCNLQLTIENMLVNWQRDIYGLISASTYINKQPQANWQVHGNIDVNKGLIKALPPFNHQQSSNNNPLVTLLPHIPCKYSFTITNKSPIEIKTPFFSSLADLKLTMLIDSSGISENTNISLNGNIILSGGTIEIGSHALLIEHGEIICNAGVGQNPYLRLTAKNRINIYAITMHVSGFLDNPHIDFESTPDLNTEQILGLLFAGTEQGNMQTTLPSILIKRLQASFQERFQQPLEKQHTFWQTLGRSLKHVHVSPEFTDSFGQTGLKGILSIDIGNRLFGRIQKSLNANDDFAFEVDYLLSDNIYGKITKDQRGDVGAEIEFRFKPSIA